MKLGVFTPLFNQLSFEEMIDAVAKKGLQTVEIGTGGYPGNAHLDIESLLASSAARKEYLAKLADKGLEISALSCHNNPISPIASVAQEADALLVQVDAALDAPPTRLRHAPPVAERIRNQALGGDVGDRLVPVLHLDRV